jgi:DNA (cytosine-5)-methyltransferase 1
VPLERSALQRLAPHPTARSIQSWGRRTGSSKRPLAIDLFCGCGGLGLGLERAGYDVVLSVDHDPRALESHRHNLPGAALDLDLSDPDRVDRLVDLVERAKAPLDLVAGGPPCQPFSRAGKSKIRSLVEGGMRPEQDERALLWQSFLAVVERLSPAAVLMENVPDMALGDELIVPRIMTERLERLGYDVEARLVEAWRHGVPQHRQRLILLARRDGRPISWPEDQPLVTLREAIGDLPRLGSSTGESQQSYRRRGRKKAFLERAREEMDGPVIHDHVTRPVREDDREAFKKLKPGDRYSDLPERLRRYRSDIFDDKYNRLDWNDLSRSITAHIAKDGYWYIHPEEHRTLTVREAARVQTFPDRFRFAGSRSDAFRQIGNAVPPALGEAIGCALIRDSRRRRLPEEQRSLNRNSVVRKALLEWAREDAKRAPWRHPGDPWTVLAGVLLGDRAGALDRSVSEFLKQFPVPSSGVSTRIRKASSARTGTEQKGYRRLAAAAAQLSKGRRAAWHRDRWVEAAEIGPADEAFVRAVGLEEDRVLTTAPVLRVVARLTGTAVDEERRLSDGRMQIARIIGAAQVPRLTAALHALGRSVCASSAPDCRRCPVKSDCHFRKNRR